MTKRASLFRQSKTAQSIVSKKGISAWLVVLCAAIMSFLMLYSITLGNVAYRVADNWRSSLTNSATIRIQAPAAQMQSEATAVEEVLRTTTGIVKYQEITPDEQQKLLAPWLGDEIPFQILTLPKIYSIETIPNFDDQSITTRLSAEAPNAIWDDHLRWRGPLLQSANRIMTISWFSTLLIGLAFALMIFLSADASTAANATSIKLLRQVGATDRWIRLGFERKFVLRSLLGGVIGAACGLLAYWAIIRSQLQNSEFVSGTAFSGSPFISAIAVVILCVVLGYGATRLSASRYLLKNT